MRTKLSEIAQLANVSIATASYVVNGKSEAKGISEATKRRVLEIARQHGYVPNRTARFLKKGRYHLIALMAPHISDFYAGLLQRIEQLAEARDYQIIFSSTFDSVEREATYLNSLIARRIDGLIILPVDIRAPHLKLLARNRVPTVFFRRRASSNAPQKFMTFDDFEVGRLAAAHLIERGCRRVAFLSAPVYVYHEYLKIIHEARAQGCRAALHEAGLPFDDSHVLLIERSAPDNNAEIAEAVVDRRFDGIVSIADDIMVHVVGVLRERGVPLPQAVKAIGCNNTELAHYCVPSLSSVELPRAELGEAMTEALFRMIDNEVQESDEVLLPPFVVERDSTAFEPAALGTGHAD